MFVNSKAALIYGSAGTGKTYLINIISSLFADRSRLYLAQTNPAVNKMKRKITASVNSTYMTVPRVVMRSGGILSTNKAIIISVSQ